VKGRRSSVHLSLPSVTHLRLVSVTRPSLPPLAYGSFRREWNERRIRDVEGRHAIHLSSRFLSQSFILRPLESHASYSRSLPRRSLTRLLGSLRSPRHLVRYASRTEWNGGRERSMRGERGERLSCLTHVGPSFHSCPPFVSRREP